MPEGCGRTDGDEGEAEYSCLFLLLSCLCVTSPEGTTALEIAASHQAEKEHQHVHSARA